MDVRAVHSRVTVWTNLCTQNSGPEWITAFTKTTEQSRDDTHFVPSDSSLPDYIMTVILRPVERGSNH